jgi:hypothetical protein
MRPRLDASRRTQRNGDSEHGIRELIEGYASNALASVMTIRDISLIAPPPGIQ